jgi:hypothetical protein
MCRGFFYNLSTRYASPSPEFSGSRAFAAYASRSGWHVLDVKEKDMGTPYQSIHIYHISDTFDKRASGKVDGAYTKHKAALGIRDAGYTFTPTVNSIDAGISVSEFFTNSQRPDRLIVAVNYAPPDNKKGTVDNRRKDFFCAALRNGDVVCGTVNGYEFSYIKPEIDQLFQLTNTNSGKSPFRSLEILPQHTLLFSEPEHRARLTQDGILKRCEDIDAIIRSVPDTTHVHEIDNFWNVKLFPSLVDLALLRDLQGKSIQFSFGQASIEVDASLKKSFLSQLSQPLNRALQNLGIGLPKGGVGIVVPTLFAAPEGTNVVALKSSSKLLGGESNVPIIATIRQRPAETRPAYRPPSEGAAVWLRADSKSLLAASFG